MSSRSSASTPNSRNSKSKTLPEVGRRVPHRRGAKVGANFLNHDCLKHEYPPIPRHQVQEEIYMTLDPIHANSASLEYSRVLRSSRYDPLLIPPCARPSVPTLARFEPLLAPTTMHLYDGQVARQRYSGCAGSGVRPQIRHRRPSVRLAMGIPATPGDGRGGPPQNTRVRASTCHVEWVCSTGEMVPLNREGSFSLGIGKGGSGHL
jgi:hypothetical protein